MSSFCCSTTLPFPPRSMFIVWAAQHELALRAAACSSSPPLRWLLWMSWPITTSGVLTGVSSISDLLIISTNSDTAVGDCGPGPVWCVDEVQSLTLWLKMVKQVLSLFQSPQYNSQELDWWLCADLGTGSQCEEKTHSQSLCMRVEWICSAGTSTMIFGSHYSLQY